MSAGDVLIVAFTLVSLAAVFAPWVHGYLRRLPKQYADYYVEILESMEYDENAPTADELETAENTEEADHE